LQESWGSKNNRFDIRLNNQRMPFEDILYDSSRICVEMAGEVISEKPDLFAEAFALVRENKGTVSSRASRAIFFGFCKDPSIIDPYIAEIIDVTLIIENTSIRQNLLRLLTEIELTQDTHKIGTLIDNCFKWIDSIESTPAIKVYSLEIVYRLSQKIPELQNELKDTIENQMEQSSVGFKSRGGRILKKLYKL